MNFSILDKFFQSDPMRPIIDKLPTFKQLVFTIVGVILLVYLFVILLSYNPSDPAWSYIGNTEVTNIGGTAGAWLADILRTFFGLGAWLGVVFLSYEIVRLWWANSAISLLMRMSVYITSMIFFSALLAYAGDLSAHTDPLQTGGILGSQVQQMLTEKIGWIFGVVFLLAYCLFVSFLFVEWRWKKVREWFFGWLGVRPEQQTDINQPVQTDDNHQASDGDLDIWQDADVSDQITNHDHALEDFLAQVDLSDELRSLNEQEDSQMQGDSETKSQNRHYDIARQAMQSIQNSHSAQVDEPDASVLESLQPKIPVNDEDFIQKTKQVSANDSFVIEENPIVHETLIDETNNTNASRQNQNDDQFERLTDKGLGQTENTNKPQPVTSETTASKSRAMDTLSYRLSLSPIPELSLLDPPDYASKPVYTQEQLAQDSELLEIKLQEFNVKAGVVSATVGPVVTRFEVELAPGLKANRVTKIAQDLARSMSKASLRVVEVIPGKPYIGIEVPNAQREMVRLIELLDTPDYQDKQKQIAIAVGKDIGGKPVIADLAKAPHMLVAGTTGSGKSVLVNSFLMSMLLKYTPDELKLVLIDPKQLELANYGDIPHLLTPVITDMKDAVAALTWCVNEMERRYQLMSGLRVRKLSEFNKKVVQAEADGEPLFDPFWKINDSVSQSKPPKLKPLPTIVIVADEFADMIMQLGKTAEEPIVRLAQKSRAAGIHLLLATQRPTVNVVTGLIKANIPSRVALRVNSKVDSRTIIEEGGAEDMLGHGDMMFIGPNQNSPERVHGAYVKDDEVNRVCDAWRERGSPDYIDLSESYTFEGEGSGDTSAESGADDLYEAAAAFVVETRRPSISSVQRKFSIGYNRAARLLDQMEERGLVSSMDSSGKRQLLL